MPMMMVNLLVKLGNFQYVSPSDIRKVQANLIDDNFKDYLRLFDLGL